MLTINLEKELLTIRKKNKAFKSYLADNDKYLKEAETLLSSEEDSSDVLQRLGMNKNLTKAQSIKNTISLQSEKYSLAIESRIFTEDQIKDLALKYRLRFLPSKYYKGSIDPQLVNHIKEFEMCNELATGKQLSNAYTSNGLRCNEHNCFILAPAESFELQERPIDPLFFVKLLDGRYYLVHKWGNDLSIFRRILGFRKESWRNYLLTNLICGFLPLFVLGYMFPTTLITHGVLYLVAVVVNIIVNIIVLGEVGVSNQFSNDCWNSQFNN